MWCRGDMGGGISRIYLSQVRDSCGKNLTTVSSIIYVLVYAKVDISSKISVSPFEKIEGKTLTELESRRLLWD
ncbi:unnamed protein product [Cochlearia groenlandica]